MSAVPKKKLCWNCDGNVSRENDNCPYCGVYLQTMPGEENQWGDDDFWHSQNEKTESPTPLFPHLELSKDSTAGRDDLEKEEDSHWTDQIKNDLFPILFLMSGSIFFLFGVVLYLFSKDGKFTLQWNGDYWSTFLILSIPCIYAGWKFLPLSKEDTKE